MKKITEILKNLVSQLAVLHFFVVWVSKGEVTPINRFRGKRKELRR